VIRLCLTRCSASKSSDSLLGRHRIPSLGILGVYIVTYGDVLRRQTPDPDISGHDPVLPYPVSFAYPLIVVKGIVPKRTSIHDHKCTRVSLRAVIRLLYVLCQPISREHSALTKHPVPIFIERRIRLSHISSKQNPFFHLCSHRQKGMLDLDASFSIDIGSSIPMFFMPFVCKRG
jgi:hypothetical protein